MFLNFSKHFQSVLIGKIAYIIWIPLVNVTKADGTRQVFDRQKVARTALRMGLSLESAEEVAKKVELKSYEGIPTKKVLQIIFSYAKIYRPEIKHMIDLRESISLLRSKPDFEQFVGLLMLEQGYDIKMNQIISGKCVEHEIDVVASKGRENVYVEVKHHMQHHTFTGLDVFLETNSVFQDLKDGYSLGKNDIDFKTAFVVSNTKISDHAKRYSECRGINYLGWRNPEGKGLEDLVERKGLYPITLLRGIDTVTEGKLGNAGIVLLKQLVEEDVSKISRATGVPKSELKSLVSAAQQIMQSRSQKQS